MVNEITLKYSAPEVSGPILNSSSASERFFRSVWADDMDAIERVYVAFMDASLTVKGYALLSSGGITGSVLDLRILFGMACKSLATALILAHNHPAGSLSPSKADVDVTRRAVEAGKLLDIKICDHVILTRSGLYSFADEGMI